MKFRNGFVSNSSSSIFLVYISNDIVSKEDFINDVFDKERLDDLLPEWRTYEARLTARDCLGRLWDDLLALDRRPDRKKWDKLGRCCQPHGTLAWGYSYCDYATAHNAAFEIHPRNWDKAEKLEEKMEKMASEWNEIVGKAAIKDAFHRIRGTLYEIEYTDGGGEGDFTSAIMEHGSFWEHLMYLKVSLH